MLVVKTLSRAEVDLRRPEAATRNDLARLGEGGAFEYVFHLSLQKVRETQKNAQNIEKLFFFLPPDWGHYHEKEGIFPPAHAWPQI